MRAKGPLCHGMAAAADVCPENVLFALLRSGGEKRLFLFYVFALMLIQGSTREQEMCVVFEIKSHAAAAR